MNCCFVGKSTVNNLPYNSTRMFCGSLYRKSLRLWRLIFGGYGLNFFTFLWELYATYRLQALYRPSITHSVYVVQPYKPGTLRTAMVYGIRLLCTTAFYTQLCFVPSRFLQKPRKKSGLFTLDLREARSRNTLQHFLQLGFTDLHASGNLYLADNWRN